MNRRLARTLRVLGWVVLGLVLAVYIGLPTAMAVAAVWPSRAQVGAAPEGFEEVTLTTSDGVELAAWYAPPRNGAALILAHGAGGSRESLRRQAEMLAARGFGVLSLDQRGHGRSSGRTNRLGWEGTRDARAATDYLLAQPTVRRIGALGYSMGGEVLLGASGSCPEIEAMVADGATRRSTPELMALPEKRTLAESFTARVMYLAVRMLTWQRPPSPLLDEMSRSKASSFLLIAAGENDLEVKFNELFANTLGARAELWVVPGVSHTGAFDRDPAEYERRVVSFLERQLTGE